MSIRSLRRHLPLAAGLAALVATACAEHVSPTTPSPLVSPEPASMLSHDPDPGTHSGHAAGDKGHILGWFEGKDVQLYYTKAYFCAEPPDSGADSGCVIGADAEVPPRGGPIPLLYAVAAVGIQPAVETLSCAAGTPCLNHPLMIDISRIRPGFASAPGLPHSHIVGERRGGWFKTVNVRVTNLDVWNQIAAAKNLEKVRELQGDPEVGGKGLISPDTPTNIFFFIASWH